MLSPNKLTLPTKRYPEDQRAAMREWYGNLITMMSEEGVREKGHLQKNY